MAVHQREREKEKGKERERERMKIFVRVETTHVGRAFFDSFSRLMRLFINYYYNAPPLWFVRLLILIY